MTQSITNYNSSAGAAHQSYSPDYSSPLTEKSSVLKARLNHPNVFAAPLDDLSNIIEVRDSNTTSQQTLLAFREEAQSRCSSKIGSGLHVKAKSIEQIDSGFDRVMNMSRQSHQDSIKSRFEDSQNRPPIEKIKNSPKKNTEIEKQDKQSSKQIQGNNRKNQKYSFRKTTKISPKKENVVQNVSKVKEIPTLFTKKSAKSSHTISQTSAQMSSMVSESEPVINLQKIEERHRFEAVAETSERYESSKDPSSIMTNIPAPMPQTMQTMTLSESKILDDQLSLYARYQPADQSSPFKLHRETSIGTQNTNNLTQTRVCIVDDQHIQEMMTPSTPDLNYQQYVHTDSSTKQTNLKESPDILNKYQERLNYAAIHVPQFNEPSTIVEQFTEEQLQQSCSQLPLSSRFRDHREYTDVNINLGEVRETHDSESFQQIKIINAVSYQAAEYFHNNHNGSSTLEDFSNEQILHAYTPSEMRSTSTVVDHKDHKDHKAARGGKNKAGEQDLRHITENITANHSVKGFVDMFNDAELNSPSCDNAQQIEKIKQNNKFKHQIEQSTLPYDDLSFPMPAFDNSKVELNGQYQLKISRQEKEPKVAISTMPLKLYKNNQSHIQSDLCKPVLKQQKELIQSARSNIHHSSPQVVHLAPKQFMERQSVLTSRVREADSIGSRSSNNQNMMSQKKLDSHLNKISRCDSRQSFRAIASFTCRQLSCSPKFNNSDLGQLKTKNSNRKSFAQRILFSDKGILNSSRSKKQSEYSKDRKQTTSHPPLSARTAFQTTALPSYRQKSKDILSKAMEKLVKSQSSRTISPGQSQFFERKVVYQTVLKNAEGELDKATLYQLKRVSDTIKNLDIHMFLELERIKQPSQPILHITKLTCVFFEIFREREEVFMDKILGLDTWKQFQDHIENSLSRCVFSLKSVLRQKSLSTENPRSKSIEASLNQLKETFFTGDNIRLIKRLVKERKPLRGLIHLVWAVICLFLNMEREFNSSNLLGLTEQPVMISEEKELIVIQTRKPTALTSQASPTKHMSLQPPSKQSYASANTQPTSARVMTKERSLSSKQSRIARDMQSARLSQKPQCVIEDVEMSPQKEVDNAKVDAAFERLYRPIPRRDMTTKLSMLHTVGNNRGSLTARTSLSKTSNISRSSIRRLHNKKPSVEIVHKPKTVNITPLTRPRKLIVKEDNEAGTRPATSRKVATAPPQDKNEIKPTKLNKKMTHKKTPTLYTKRDTSPITDRIDRGSVKPCDHYQSGKKAKQTEKRWNAVSAFNTRKLSVKPDKTDKTDKTEQPDQSPCRTKIILKNATPYFKRARHHTPKSSQKCDTQKSVDKTVSSRATQVSKSTHKSVKSHKSKSTSTLKVNNRKKPSGKVNFLKHKIEVVNNTHVSILETLEDNQEYPFLPSDDHKNIETRELLCQELPSFGGFQEGIQECMVSNLEQTVQTSTKVTPVHSRQVSSISTMHTPVTLDPNGGHFNEVSPLIKMDQSSKFISGQYESEIHKETDQIDGAEFSSQQSRHKKNREERRSFILEKAQQINENLFSFQQAQSFAKQRLQSLGQKSMRRSGGNSSDLSSRVTDKNGASEQDCLDKYLEPTTSAAIFRTANTTYCEDQTFTDALQTLRYEVESLMQK